MAITHPQEEHQYIDPLDQTDDYEVYEESSEVFEPNRIQYNIDTYTNSVPVERLVDDYKNGILTVPEFQRPYVWSKDDPKTARNRPSLFVDSILRGLPVPPITIYKTANAREQGLIIDGQQRIKTLNWFINNQLDGRKIPFKLMGEGIFDDWKGRDFASLPNEIKSLLLRAWIPVTYIRQLNEDQPKLPQASSLYVLFDRVNSGGVQLMPHEKRSVLLIYNPTRTVLGKFLTNVYEMPEWMKILKYNPQKDALFKSTRFKELIFRIYAFYFFQNEYKGYIARFLDNFMLTYEMSDEQAQNCLINTQKTLSMLMRIYELEQKLFYTGTSFNIAFYESFTVGLLKIFSCKENVDFDKLYSAYKNIQHNALYYGADGKCYKSKVTTEAIASRFSLVHAFMESSL